MDLVFRVDTVHHIRSRIPHPRPHTHSLGRETHFARMSSAAASAAPRALKQLSQQVIHRCHEAGMSLEPFLADFLSRYLDLAYRFRPGDPAAQEGFSAPDFSRMVELASSLVLNCNGALTTPANVTSHTLRVLECLVGELGRYHSHVTRLQAVPRAAAERAFAKASAASDVALVYEVFEEMLGRVFCEIPGPEDPRSTSPEPDDDLSGGGGLEVGSAAGAAGGATGGEPLLLAPLALTDSSRDALKLSLASVLPLSDVAVFRDMLLREHEGTPAASIAEGKPSNAVIQLLELGDIAVGVAVVGAPPLQQLQAIERACLLLRKSVDLQFQGLCDIYAGSLLPLLLHELDRAAPGDLTVQSRCRELIVYALNRFAALRLFSALARESRNLAARVSSSLRELHAGVSELHAILQERETLPKSTVYPKFVAVSTLYRDLAIAADALFLLKRWHGKAMFFLEDSGFTVLPGSEAKAPLFTAEELTEARAWFLQTYKVLSPARVTEGPGERRVISTAIPEGVESRFLKLALAVSSRETALSSASVFKDLSSFAPVDSESLLGADYLFGGLDPTFCVSPAFSRLGGAVLTSVPGFCLNAYRASSVQQPSIAGLGLHVPQFFPWGSPDAADRGAGASGAEVSSCFTTAALASELASNLLVVPDPAEGFAPIALSSSHSRAMLASQPVLFMAAPLALSLASPEFLPLVLLMDLPRVSSILASEALVYDREAFLSSTKDMAIDLQPCFHAGVVGTAAPPAGLAGLLRASGSAGPAAPSSALAGTSGLAGTHFQTDIGGFPRGTPQFASLASKTILLKNLALSDALAGEECGVLNSPFDISELLDPETLGAFSALASDPAFSRYREAERAAITLRGEDFAPVMADGRPGPRPRPSGQPQAKRISTIHEGYLNDAPAEAAIQTPLHFYETRIVPGYTSSEWELRARALRLYQIKQKRTHETQTFTSTFKVTAGTQSVEKADAECQSGHDASTHAVQHFRYIRRSAPESLDSAFERAARLVAQDVRTRSEIRMDLDFDEIERESRRLLALRAGKRAEGGAARQGESPASGGVVN